MTEEEAKGWVAAHVSRETLELLSEFIDFLLAESLTQNLISKGSVSEIWARHIVDSAQLLRFAPSADASWVDLGTGAGFPGLVVALLHSGPVTLIEERRLRVDFLHRASESLGIADKVTIRCSKVERVVAEPFDVISARAFAPLERLLGLGHSFSTAKTRWILPKGRNAPSELEAVSSSWQGNFRLEPSITDAEASIIVADAVEPRQGRGKSRGSATNKRHVAKRGTG